MTNIENLRKVADALGQSRPYADETIVAVAAYMDASKKEDFKTSENWGHYYWRKGDTLEACYSNEHGNRVVGAAVSIRETQQRHDAAKAAPEQPERPIPAFLRSKTEREAAKLGGSANEIVKLSDIGNKPQLATDELMKRGSGVSLTRTTYRPDGTEIVNSYKLQGGNVIHTAPSGKETAMTVAEARRFELDALARTNSNTLALLQELRKNEGLCVKQGDKTFSVEGNNFICEQPDGKFTIVPVSEVQQRLLARGDEINAMRTPSTERAARTDFKAIAADFKAAGKPEADKGRAVEAEQGA